MLSCQRRSDIDARPPSHIGGATSSQHVQWQTKEQAEEYSYDELDDAPAPTQPSQGPSQGVRRVRSKGKGVAESSSHMMERRAHRRPGWMQSPEYPKEDPRAKAPSKRGKKK